MLKDLKTCNITPITRNTKNKTCKFNRTSNNRIKNKRNNKLLVIRNIFIKIGIIKED